MSIYTLRYGDGENRTTIILKAESQGHRMLHDDYDTGSTDRGTLTFDAAPQTQPPRPEYKRLAALRTKLAVRNLTLPEINDMLALERGL